MSESASMFDSPPERARETVRVRECAFVKVFVNGRGVGRSSEVKVRVCVREGLFMRENERGGESLPERERERKRVWSESVRAWHWEAPDAPSSFSSW